MKIENSAVAEWGIPEPFALATAMLEKLKLHADSWDLAEDLKAGIEQIVPVDARSTSAYLKSHIPGAIGFPHRTMDETTTAKLDRSKLYIVYCDGIGCNASTKGAYKLSRLGFHAKELLGGLDWWIRDGHPISSGEAPGDLRELL